MAHSRGNRLSVAEYAKHRGVSRQAVYNALNEGRIAKEPDGKIDQAKADAMWSANTSVAAGRLAEPETSPAAAASAPPKAAARPPVAASTPTGEVMNYNDARTAHEHYKAELARLKFEEEAGLLVRADEVERRWTDILRAIQARVFAVVPRVVDRSGVEDGHALRVLLEAELRSALAGAADDIAGMDEE